MERLYLSKRNLLTLLSKLERLEEGQNTVCAIVKYANTTDPYCNTIDGIVVIAIPDELFYVNRAPGLMHPLDESNMQNNGVH
jgi:hypothetical protein